MSGEIYNNLYCIENSIIENIFWREKYCWVLTQILLWCLFLLCLDRFCLVYQAISIIKFQFRKCQKHFAKIFHYKSLTWLVILTWHFEWPRGSVKLSLWEVLDIIAMTIKIILKRQQIPILTSIFLFLML